MPMCSRIAVYGLEPLIGDFLTALTVMNATVTGIFITVYVWSFGNLLKRVFALSSSNTIFASALFLISISSYFVQKRLITAICFTVIM